MRRGFRAQYSLRARTRCELYALGIAELHEICAQLNDSQRDEMAGIIFNDWQRRNQNRSTAMKIVHRGIKKQADLSDDYRAALRLQTRWLQLTSKRAGSIRINSHNLRKLLPALYRDTTSNSQKEAWSGTAMGLSFKGSTASFIRPSKGLSPDSSFGQPPASPHSMEAIVMLHQKLDRVEERLAALPTFERITECIQQASRDAVKAYMQAAPPPQPLPAPGPGRSLSTPSSPRRSPRRFW